ncbi:LacI family DNA-binding transcriptional regulator [Sinomonas sp. P47F7]|uniref:LacI family DNA-binding transcriptional regulator n=1 Tax=Sinomonas sp. P47F7 TaxID=3410987 RepID=UPI003BF53DE4
MVKPQSTIYDIAALVGLNASTVSRALSRPDRVSAKTLRRVEDAARQLDYQVNSAARAVKTGRLQTIGLLVPDITYSIFQDILRGAEHAARDADYVVLVGEEVGSAQAEWDWVRRVQSAVDGVILASPWLEDSRIREVAATKSLVVVNRVLDGVPSVMPDVASGVGAAVARAAELGHRRLLYLAGPEGAWMSKHRWEVLEAACADAGIEATSTPGHWPTREGGAALADDVLASGCSLAVVFNDLMAIGLLQELQRRHVPVPERLSIIGFDNIRGSDFTSPRLATIGAPLHEVGERAVKVLLAGADASPARSKGAASEPGAPSFGLAASFYDRGSLGPAAG